MRVCGGVPWGEGWGPVVLKGCGDRTVGKEAARAEDRLGLIFKSAGPCLGDREDFGALEARGCP